MIYAHKLLSLLFSPVVLLIFFVAYGTLKGSRKIVWLTLTVFYVLSMPVVV